MMRRRTGGLRCEGAAPTSGGPGWAAGGRAKEQQTVRGTYVRPFGGWVETRLGAHHAPGPRSAGEFTVNAADVWV